MAIHLTQVLAHWQMPAECAQPFGPVWKIATPDGDYCLKPGKHGVARLLFDYHAIEWLWTNGCSRTPRFLPTTSGAPFAATSDGPFALQRWVGRTLDSAARNEWLAAARALAHFHLASTGMQLPAGVRRVSFSGKWGKRFAERQQELAQTLATFAAPRNEFEAAAKETSEPVVRLATRAMTILQNSEYERLVEEIQVTPSLVHGNVKAENFTVDSAGHVHVIDFDAFRFDVSVQDVSDLFQAALPAQDWSFAFAEQLLAAYQEVRPLPPAEVPVLLALMMFPYRPYTTLHKYCTTDRPLEKSLRKWRVATAQLQQQDEFLQKWASRLLNCVQ